MNITDYIVAYLKQGKTVELPGIGSFATQQLTAHYDSGDGTFFPTHETLTFSNVTHGDKGIVQYIADQECIDASTAEQMFKNYLDVLQEKLTKEHSHTFPGIGTLQKEGFAVSFLPDDKLNLDDDTIECPAITNVKIYDAASCDNPFAQFEQAFQEEVVAIPQPAAAAEQPAPELAPADEAQPQESLEEAPEELEEIAETADNAMLQADETPAPEEECDATEPADATRQTALDELAAADKAMRDLKFHLTQPQAQEEPTAAPDVADAASTDASPNASAAAQGNDAAPAPTGSEALSSLQKMEEIPAQKQAGKSSDKKTKSAAVAAKPKKKKKGHRWVVVAIIVLCLCLLAGAAYYYFKVYQPANASSTTAALQSASQPAATGMEANYMTDDEQSPASPEETRPIGTASAAPADKLHSIVKPNNDFTFATDNITYTPDDIVTLSSDISNYLKPYILNYLSSRRYSKAGDAVMQKVQQYAEQRMTEILRRQGFHVQDFFNYSAKDYMHTYYEKDLKTLHSTRQRIVVQSELMNEQTLSKLLDEALRENAIVADAAPRKAQPAPVPRAASRDNTKKGFDVIAGFYVNRSGADKMANSLKKKGCDAYIINKDGLYYVSMGSAGSQTAAEALYHHIKEWYKGDVAIKKW